VDEVIVSDGREEREERERRIEQESGRIATRVAYRSR
jgi:hypothetical protein